MAPDWRSSSIGELCATGTVELQTGPFGTQLHAYDYVNAGIAIVPTEAIRGRQIDHSVLPKITKAKAQQLERHRLNEGDILFARRGVQATGHIGYVRSAEEGFICGTGAIRLRVAPTSDSIDSDYLSHVLANPVSVEWFKFHAIGATMPNLNEGIIRSFPLSIPPLAEQRAIAHILGTLDDKIELNHRRNQTLESMARALFQDWFVDFGPVRAKMEGREPYLPTDLWQLFPDRLDDGGKPQGWDLGTLADFAILNPESWSKKNTPEAIEYVDLANTKFGAIETPARLPWSEAPSRAQRVLRPGDTIVGTVRPGNGSFAMIDAEGLTGSTGFAVLRPLQPQYREFVFLAATAVENIDRLSHLADGAAYPAVRPDVVLASPLDKPDKQALDDLLRGFSKFAGVWMDSIEVHKLESKSLAQLRDTLLPKLISGELRIADAEKFAALR